MTAAVAVIGTGTAAWWGRHRLGRLVAEHTPERAWFHVHPPHHDLWGARDQVVCDGELLDRFAAGLRADLPMVVQVPPPKPDGPTQRSYAGLAALTRPSGRVLVGVLPEDAARVPFAAAGCGLLARAVPGLPAGAREVTGDVAVDAVPGWMVGTDASGEPVTVNLPPGATVLVSGARAAEVVSTVAVTGRTVGPVAGADVAVVSTVAAWREAWHPQTCRVVVCEDAAALADSIAVDLTVDLDAGQLRCGETTLPFRRLPLR
ncbi:hypothetical protein [Corynebacterium sp.]|uniref:hypothetical protein n=1 Tax=Corynebacterium sp. TaxID=1720 RepID=UPI0025BADB22|nr:hypothetical protein [Corynebacterium sp.]